MGMNNIGKLSQLSCAATRLYPDAEQQVLGIMHIVSRAELKEETLVNPSDGTSAAKLEMESLLRSSTNNAESKPDCSVRRSVSLNFL